MMGPHQRLSHHFGTRFRDCAYMGRHLGWYVGPLPADVDGRTWPGNASEHHVDGGDVWRALGVAIVSCDTSVFFREVWRGMCGTAHGKLHLTRALLRDGVSELTYPTHFTDHFVSFSLHHLLLGLC